MTTTALIAVDWGTTSLRVWGLDEGGAIVQHARSDRGVRETAATATREGEQTAAAFEAALHATAGEILNAGPEAPIIMCGMVGSRDGWREVPYLTTPCGVDEIGRSLRPVAMQGRRAVIVPGLLQPRSAVSWPDVMRGEETQCVGIAAQRGEAASLHLVLPGTHTKWVQVADGRIRDFETSMTGELWDAILGHTIVGRGAVGRDIDLAAFERGRRDAADGARRRDLAGLLFGSRALMLTGELAPGGVASYVSGVLIGDEVAHQVAGLPVEQPLLMAGEPTLTRLYAAAIEAEGHHVDVLPDPTRRGLWEIARRSNLLGDLTQRQQQTPD